MFNFIKKNKLIIYSDQSHDPFLEKCFEIHPQNTPEWLKNLPTFIFPEEMKNKEMSFVQKMFHKLGTTIKTCYGINRYLKNTVVFKSPIDFVIILENNSWKIKTSNESSLIEIGDHHWSQFPFIKENFYHIKIAFGYIKLSTNANTINTFFNSPFYHDNFIKNGSLQVFPGYVPLHNKSASKFTINFGIRKDSPIKEFYIKAGDPLLYMTFDENVVIEFKSFNDPSLKDKMSNLTNQAKKFIGNEDYFQKNL